MHGEAKLRSSATSVSALRASQNDDEAERLADVFYKVLRELPYYNDRAKAGELKKYTSAKLRDSALTDPHSVFVAKVDEHLAGFLFSHIDDETVWLSWFGVLPKYRKSGVGGAL